MGKLNVAIADDNQMTLELLGDIVSSDNELQVIGTAKDGEEAVTICATEEIDVALLDIRMPKMSGVEAVKEIASKTDTKCLILTTFDEEDYINEAMEYGAKGYILKNSTPDQIVQSITSVYNNTIVMNENVLNKFQGNKGGPQFTKYDL